MRETLKAAVPGAETLFRKAMPPLQGNPSPNEACRRAAVNLSLYLSLFVLEYHSLAG